MQRHLQSLRVKLRRIVDPTEYRRMVALAYQPDHLRNAGSKVWIL